jgi:hypothetical protein
VRKLISVQEALGTIQNYEVILIELSRCGRSQEVVALRRRARSNLTSSRELALHALARLSEDQALAR